MKDRLEQTIAVLERLVSFESISGRPTHDIVGYIKDYLLSLGVEPILSFDEAGERANVFASVGPDVEGGVVFNGHTDVVPVTGQDWSTDPFTLTRKGERLYGRGSVDMKGFLACVLGSVPVWQEMELKKPIHIAFSYDEEVGGFGMPVLLEDLHQRNIHPEIAIVGEPTEMKIVSGHKGGYEMRTTVSGLETHACNPLLGVSAISYAARYIAKIEEVAARFAAEPEAGSPYEPPFTTFNVGTISGGTARNAVAGTCSFDWEVRPLPGHDGLGAVREIMAYAAEHLVPEMRRVHPAADIVTTIEAPVPPLNDRNAAQAIAFVRELTGLNSEEVVSFGTDAGYFSEKGISTVVFGPGSIDRAHKPDEFIEVSELAAGLGFLEKVGRHLTH